MNITYNTIKEIIENHMSNEKLLTAYRFDISDSKELSLYDGTDIIQALNVSLYDGDNNLIINIHNGSWVGHTKLPLTESEKYDYLSLFIKVEEYYKKLTELKIKNFTRLETKSINDLDDDD